MYLDKTTLRIGYVQFFFVRTDHYALVFSPWATRQPTGHRLVGGGHAPFCIRHCVRRPGMYSNNNCSISRLLDWFPCFYRRTEQGSRIQQTPLRPRCGIARLICFLNVSPVNAKITSPSWTYVFTLMKYSLKRAIPHHGQSDVHRCHSNTDNSFRNSSH